MEEKYTNFINTIRKGNWRDRYYAVQAKRFIELGLDNNKPCTQLLVQCALSDYASLVRQEAVRTCNILGIQHKGKPISLKRMPSLLQIIQEKDKKLQEKFFMACVKAEIPMYPQKRTLNEDELRRISIKFSELYPTLYDKIDGRTSENVAKKKNKHIYKMIQTRFNQISAERIERYCKHHKGD